MQETSVAMLMQRWTAICALALIAATYALWIPQTAFPQIPAFALFCATPASIDWIGLAGLVVGLTVLAAWQSDPLSNIGSLLVLASLMTLICLDQHRFQPWAYQLGLFSAIWLCCKNIPLRLSLMRWLMIGIYFYSAIGKLDFEFLHSVGQQMLNVIAKWCGQDLTNIPDSIRIAFVVAFPVTELAIAAGLVWPKSRKVAGISAIGLHVALIAVLGPLGLNHRLGVLIWNGQFAVQAYLLFVVKPLQDDRNNQRTNATGQPKFNPWRYRFQETFCMLLVAFVSIMPCTERFGIWDHWPSWALYAPHSSRVRLEIAGPSVSSLPTDLVALIGPTAGDNEETEWFIIPMDAWSLKTLDTPIYPQSRFQLGVSRQIASELRSELQVRVTILGTANRYTGLRKTSTFYDENGIEKAGDLFWLNTIPRRR